MLLCSVPAQKQLLPNERADYTFYLWRACCTNACPGVGLWEDHRRWRSSLGGVHRLFMASPHLQGPQSFCK